MTTKRTIQTALLVLALTLVLASKAIASIGAMLIIAGLSLVAVVCFWFGIDYFKAKKKYLGVLMLVSALAVIYIIFETFIMPNLQ